jgi:hypothetical protein
MCVCMCVGTYVRLRLKKGHTSFSPEFGMLNALKKGRHFKRLILLKSVLGSNPGESGFLVRKLRAIVQRRQHQSCFRGRGYSNNGRDPKKQSWGAVTVKVITVARKLNVIETKVCFIEDISEQRRSGLALICFLGATLGICQRL